MIRINLTQNLGRGSRPAQSTNTNVGTSPDFVIETTNASFGGDQADMGALVVRIGLLLSLPILLIAFEQHQLSILKSGAVAAQAITQQLEATLSEKKAIITQSADLKAKAKELATKIEIMKKLAKLRLREIKALDFIQSNIPDRVWLKELNLKSGAMVIRGGASTDDDLTLFVKSLEKSRGFSSVLLLQANEQRGAEGSVKNFEITGTVEVD